MNYLVTLSCKGGNSIKQQSILRTRQTASAQSRCKDTTFLMTCNKTLKKAINIALPFVLGGGILWWMYRNTDFQEIENTGGRPGDYGRDSKAHRGVAV